MFLIVINIQKNQTICFEITGMPSLSFSIIYALGGRRGAGGGPSGRAARRCEHNERERDDSASPALLHKRRQKEASCGLREAGRTLTS